MSDDPPNTLSVPYREQGFLLIADMESSTMSKFVLDELDAFNALKTHNQLVMQLCGESPPGRGVILNSLGDSVVAKFPSNNDPEDALRSCLHTANAIISTFENLSPLPTKGGREFRLRTKILLQHYDAYTYGRDIDNPTLREELVGPDIDLAFRLEAVAWRLQILVTAKFLGVLLSYSQALGGADSDADSIMDRAHIARHRGAAEVETQPGLSEHFKFAEREYWITDAREIPRLKGIAHSPQVFALAFESRESLLSRGEQQRPTIKVRQNHHALIMVDIALEQDRNDDYIDHVLGKLVNAENGNRLDSEITVFAAAKIYGEFDFFFRVSCIDDDSLRRFLHAIHADSFGLRHIDVRSTVANRCLFTRNYKRIHQHLTTQSYELILTWFERIPGRDLFSELSELLRASDAEHGPVAVLEIGEVIHHTPVYAIFVCRSISDYSTFLAEHGFRATACRSHVGHVGDASDAQLRYGLMGGVFLPRQLS